MDEREREMLYNTDKYISIMSSNVDQLTDDVKVMNNKITDILSVIQTQTVLLERVNNIDINVSDAFKRYNEKLDKVTEIQQSVDGCAPLRSSNATILTVKKDMRVIDKRVVEVEESYIKAATVRWAVVLLFGYVTTFSTYIVTSIHEQDNRIIRTEVLIDDLINKYEVMTK